MPHTDVEWEQAWKGFFDSIGSLIDMRAGTLVGPKRSLATGATPPLIADIRDNGWPPVLAAINNFKDPSHTSLEDTLYDELILISQGNVNARDPTAQNVALEDSETGKKSLEDLLGSWLPEWLKKALKLLNEILKLLRS